MTTYNNPNLYNQPDLTYAGPKYFFTTPTVWEGSPDEERLYDFYEWKRGVTVYRIGATYGQVRFPTKDLLNSVDEYWLGGRKYEISSTAAAGLTAAGFGSYISSI